MCIRDRFYGHLPDLLSVAGMAVIVGSSLSIALMERFRQPGMKQSVPAANR